MASTITAGTLTVKITENVSLNSTNYDSVNILTIPSINEVNQRIVTLAPQAQVILFTFDTETGPGQYVSSDVQYLRITNKDDANSVGINIQTIGGGGQNNWTILNSGRSYILGSAATSMEAVASAVVGTPVLQDIAKITAYGPTAAAYMDLECYIAST